MKWQAAWIGVCSVAAVPVGLLAQSREPIIDMHMHARTSAIRTESGAPSNPPCIPAGCEPIPTVVKSDADVMRLALDAMERNNIVLGVVSDRDLERVAQWVSAAPDRVIPGVQLVRLDDFDLDEIRRRFAQGSLKVMGEIGTQYDGVSPDDPRLEPIFALAEELDVPTLIHTEGIAAPSSRFKIAHGHPELLQSVIERHPSLRLYFENAGYPFLDEMIAIMYRYPQVYADLSTITWIIPRKEFYRYFQALLDAGLGKRLMWGSDQMNWPGTIDEGLKAIREAPFLSEEQRRDILYNNAAEFLRLEAPP